MCSARGAWRFEAGELSPVRTFRLARCNVARSPCSQDELKRASLCAAITAPGRNDVDQACERCPIFGAHIHQETSGGPRTSLERCMEIGIVVQSKSRGLGGIRGEQVNNGVPEALYTLASLFLLLVDAFSEPREQRRTGQRNQRTDHECETRIHLRTLSVVERPPDG